MGAAAALLILLLFAGCSSRVSTEDIRGNLTAGSLDSLADKMREADEDHQEFVTALNLARIYQLQGRWRDSIAAFERGIGVLEEYESRARISLRDVLGGAGSILISRGSSGYYGTGYERSLLHTFNAINYLMLGDFSGAAVELRRMEERQEMWLEEEEFRIQQYLEEQQAAREAGDDLDLPGGYSMAHILNDPEVRALTSTYQDPFSYSLSAIVCRLAGDWEYAQVSLRRAALLSEGVREMFTRAWKLDKQNGAKSTPTADWYPRIAPPAGSPYKPLAENATGFLPAEIFPFSGARSPEASAQTKTAGQQEVVVLALSGLAPALRMEQIRISAPYVGYVMVDLPSYVSAVRPSVPQVESVSGRQFEPLYLLRTELLAYRFLRDEVRYEVGSAISRALVRAAVSGTAYAAARSNEDTEAYAPLIGFFTSVIMDAFASGTSQSVRNWETLPAAGYLAMGSINRGDGVRVRLGGQETEITPPLEARGLIIMVSQTTTSRMRVDYVAY